MTQIFARHAPRVGAMNVTTQRVHEVGEKSKLYVRRKRMRLYSSTCNKTNVQLALCVQQCLHSTWTEVFEFHHL